MPGGDQNGPVRSGPWRCASRSTDATRQLRGTMLRKLMGLEVHDERVQQLSRTAPGLLWPGHRVIIAAQFGFGHFQMQKPMPILTEALEREPSAQIQGRHHGSAVVRSHCMQVPVPTGSGYNVRDLPTTGRTRIPVITVHMAREYCVGTAPSLLGGAVENVLHVLTARMEGIA